MTSKRYSKSKALTANIKAIDIALTIRNERRSATEKEKDILSDYMGFGGLKCIAYSEDRKEWPKSERSLFPLVLELKDTIKKRAKSKAEESLLLSSLKLSTKTGFYTPVTYVKAICSVIDKYAGERISSILEPSAGNGVFLQEFRREGRKITAYEKDLLSGLILAAKEESINTDIRIDDFKNIPKKEKGEYDLVISNIPFGNIRIFDASLCKSQNLARRQSTQRIHNYFFIKSLDFVKDGGLVAFITSRGIADSISNRVIREYLMNHSNLISVIRLPDDMFLGSGTTVGTDLIILQKNEKKTFLSEDEKLFIESSNWIYEYNEGFSGKHISNIAKNQLINNKWRKHAIGIPYQDKNLYGDAEIRFDCKGIDALSELTKILEENFKNNYNSKLATNNITINKERVFEYENIILSSLKLWNIYNNEDSYGKQKHTLYLDDIDTKHFYEGKIVEYNNKIGMLFTKDKEVKFSSIDFFSSESCALLKDYIRVRNAYWKLFDSERETGKEQPVLRESLNFAYKLFYEKHGGLRDNNHINILGFDMAYNDIMKLEQYYDGQIYKSDIFKEPVSIFDEKKPELASCKKALLESLNLYAGIDIDFIEERTGKGWEYIRADLKGEIFYNPLNNVWEEKNQMIAGNLYTKIEEIEKVYNENALNNEQKEETSITLTALYNSLPIKVPFEMMDLGIERWMGNELLSNFATDFLGISSDVSYIPSLDRYDIVFKENKDKADTLFYLNDLRLEDLLLCAFSNIIPEIKKEGNVDIETTQLALLKVQEIQQLFSNWIKCLPSIKKEYLTNQYNCLFNCFVNPQYNGSFQTFPELSKDKIKDKALHSLKDIIWFLKQNKGGVCNYNNGTEKIMTMCITSHEMNRTGICNKPLIVTSNTNIFGIVHFYHQAYPDAKLFHFGESFFNLKDRENSLIQIRDNEFDCIILTYEQFEKIPCSEHFSKQKENTTANVIMFEELGIDHIFVDDANFIKNQNLGNGKESAYSLNLLYAIRSIQEKQKEDFGATLFLNETFEESFSNLYVLFKYLLPHELERQNINSFDAWASIYEKKIFDKEEFLNYYIKVPELMMQYKRMTATKSLEKSQVKLLETNIILRNIQLTSEQNLFKEKIKNFIVSENEESIDDIFFNTKNNESKIIIATNIEQKMAVDMRLINPFKYHKEKNEHNKLSECARSLYDYYIRYNNVKGIQVVFSDVGNYKSGKWNVYSELKDILKEHYGIPGDEIKIVQEFEDSKKIHEFYRTLNKGNVRVMLGSSPFFDLRKGINILHQQIVAVHHLDIPLKFSTFQRRNDVVLSGQNSKHLKNVEEKKDVLVYCVKDTSETYRFNLLQNKLHYINQIKTGKTPLKQINKEIMDMNKVMCLSEYIKRKSMKNNLNKNMNMEKLEMEIPCLAMENEAVFEKNRNYTMKF